MVNGMFFLPPLFLNYFKGFVLKSYTYQISSEQTERSLLSFFLIVEDGLLQHFFCWVFDQARIVTTVTMFNVHAKITDFFCQEKIFKNFQKSGESSYFF